VDLGLIAGVVGAVAGVAAVVLAFLQLRAAKPAKGDQPWPEIKPPRGTGARRPEPGTESPAADPQKPAPSAADFGLPVRVLTERLPTYVRGRKALLNRLQRHAAQGGLVVLTGSGGMGKSTVARELVRQMRARTPGEDAKPVWEVSAADLSSLTGGLITIAAGLGAAESDLQAISIPTPAGPDRFWRLLEASTEGWLLIIDNADQQELLAAPAAPGGTNGRRLHDNDGWARATRRGLVLVTSRRRENRPPEGLRSKNYQNVIWPDDAILYEVGPLSDSEAAAVLLDWAPRAGDRDEARRLGHRLGGLPLALRLVGQYLTSGYVRSPTFAAYVSALDSDPRMIQLLDPDLDDPERVEREMVMFTWEMSLDALTDYGLPQARVLLRLISCYAPAVPIPLSLFTSELSQLLHMPGEPAVSSAAGRVQTDQVLRGLDHLGLIDAARLPDSEADDTADRAGRRRMVLHGQDALVVHPVIADTNRVYLLAPRPSDPEPLLVRGQAVRLLATALDALSTDQPSDWPAFRILVPHLQALIANSASWLNDDTLDVLVKAAGHTAVAYGQMRSPEFGLELAKSALSYISHRTGDPTAAVLTARQQQAHLLIQVGRAGEAAEIYRGVLGAQRRLWHDDDDPAILATRRNLGIALSEQPGHAEEAQAILEGVLTDERRVLGDDDPSTLVTRLNLVTLRSRSEQEWPQAEDDLRSLLIDVQRVLGPDHLTTLMLRHNLAKVILNRGRRPEAEKLFDDLLADERRLLGDDHFVTATTSHFDDNGFLTSSVFSNPEIRKAYAAKLLKKGVGLKEQNRPDEAIGVWRQLIDRFDNDQDPALGGLAARASQYQGIALAELGRPAEALAGIEQAVNRYGELAAAHPAAFADDLSRAQQVLAGVRLLAAQALLGQGAALAEQQQDDQAIRAWQELTDRFGRAPDLPLRRVVAMGLVNQGIVLGRQRKWDEAVHAVEQAVETYEELAAAEPGAAGDDLESARQFLAELRDSAAEPGPDEG
jgi:tetratricopeptide (TPR) repeat protein/energy-coupling factor transporter ATP-binding protein EcfA2